MNQILSLLRNRRTLVLKIAVTSVLSVAIALAVYHFARTHSSNAQAMAGQGTGHEGHGAMGGQKAPGPHEGHEAAPAKKLRYQCPMHPTYTSDRPGQCPICGMTLVPIKEGP